MKLWLIKLLKEPSYNEFGGFVVRTETEDQAWELARAVVENDWVANQKPVKGDEWTCEELFVDGEPMVVLPHRIPA